jgi:superoxide dismutase, Fe-Mn family
MKRSYLIFSTVILSIVLISFKPNTGGVKEYDAASIPVSSGFSPEDQFLTLADNSMKYPYIQEKLPYGYDALEPYIDKQTMEIHYSKHHAAYTENFNKAVEASNLKDASLFEIFGMISKLPAAIRNNGGGFYNHLMFWQVMAPNAGGLPTGNLAEAINTEFGAFERFRDKFTDAAKTQFGSGWAWLVVNADGKLAVTKTSNQDNPLMDVAEVKGIPILCLDVWEHAYYLKYQNKRPDYIAAFWNVINWKEVERRYTEALNVTMKK